ncbi:MAG TPA: serine/threonine-protein kinase, partial [Gemmatimonadales bacterium]|nr:serine/threonine-protein kinase [Gemmatimonadales bacterium]
MGPEEAPDRARRAGALFAEALEREGAERERFLRDACAGDERLRADVESLLAAHGRPGAVDRLGAEIEPIAARLRGPAATLAGSRVGRYQVIERIGGGGMGVVYRGMDTRLDRPVALKFLVPRLRADDSAAERFRLEARAIAALDHPNICTLYEIGEGEGGHLFLAMPLYDGETLQARIARGPLPVGEAVAIAIQVARGLAKAHARGIVHRDIKSSNVLITDDGIVKLLDFGIAKLTGVALTGAAGPLGTTPYMSPEQVAGSPVDHRTDLWSLGVLLFEMLAGRKPFAGQTASEVSEAIRRGDLPSLARQRADVPAPLERIVATALRKRREERYQSAQEFEAELLTLGVTAALPAGAITPSPPAGPQRAGRRARGLARGALAAVAVLLLAVALSLTLPRRRATAARVPASIAVLPFADRSAAGDQEYFTNGITDELIATLARIEGLRVA